MQIYGDFTNISNGHPSIFAYVRTLNESKALVLLNFGENEVDFNLQDSKGSDEFILVLGNYQEDSHLLETPKSIRLRGYESRLYISK